ncbi:hypothetical protein H4R99_006127 [Coemansia sp. RSA 1722]|nr:hypothetical protein IWW45_007496 [Coemansia sp. RSA 485]KAJ2593329.1 hypothetical protein H4R99_006127 [Coemansia sp. RSA 1722]
MTGRYRHVRDAILKEAGGIDDAVDTLMMRFEDFIDKQNEDSRRAAVGPSGVILSGIPGCGKSKLAHLFAQNTGLWYETVNCPELFLADQGKSEAQLAERFAVLRSSGGKHESKQMSRSGSARILIFEEIDVISGSSRPDTMEARMFSLLLSCIDSNRDVFVVATTSRPQAIPEEIKRVGRLDTVIDIHFADAGARAAALHIMLRQFDNIASSDDIDRIAKAAHGFSAADLQSLCLRTFMEHRKKTTAEDLLRMVLEVKPSNLSSFQSKIPPVRFADMFGLDDTISLVRAVVVEPLMNAEKYLEMQVEPPRGALIYGPPGCGKSMLCCALANELSVNAIWVDSTQLRSMIVGESEKAIADLFAQARKSAPCILLFDNVSRATSYLAKKKSLLWN